MVSDPAPGLTLPAGPVDGLRFPSEPSLNELPVLDPGPLGDLLELGGSPELVQELITLYREDVPLRLSALAKAVEAGDLLLMAAEAHQLKGSLGNLGLVRFADLAARIEDRARGGRLDGVPELFGQLPAEHDAALSALVEAFPLV